LIGLDLVLEPIENMKIIDRSKTAQSRQRSYLDVRKRDLEFYVGERVYVKVFPMKGVIVLARGAS
ncbi:MAG: hypothetical protein Q8830_03235, partial [Candidatus Phytoplasma australasiaticum]|nr:hypothetical protein [Candidatus Phytoplasma australasiaticum]